MTTLKLKRIPAPIAGYGREQGTCDYETLDGRFRISKIWSRGTVWQCRAQDGTMPFRMPRFSRRQPRRYSAIYNGESLRDVRDELAMIYELDLDS